MGARARDQNIIATCWWAFYWG